MCAYYIEKGLDGLTSLHYPKHCSKLYNHRDEIVTHLTQNPLATIAQARARMKELTGMDRSLQQVRLFTKTSSGRQRFNVLGAFDKARPFPGIKSRNLFDKEKKLN